MGLAEKDAGKRELERAKLCVPAEGWSHLLSLWKPPLQVSSLELRVLAL